MPAIWGQHPLAALSQILLISGTGQAWLVFFYSVHGTQQTVPLSLLGQGIKVFRILGSWITDGESHRLGTSLFIYLASSVRVYFVLLCIKMRNLSHIVIFLRSEVRCNPINDVKVT